MAVWLVRALDGADPPRAEGSRFVDVDTSLWWSAHTVRLAELGVTRGCGVEPLRFCPRGAVTRSQMAAFLVRAFELGEGPGAGFADVDPGSVFAGDIDALFAAGVTVGCGSEPLRFCPSDAVARAQTATFLHRSIALVEQPEQPDLTVSWQPPTTAAQTSPATRSTCC